MNQGHAGRRLAAIMVIACCSLVPLAARSLPEDRNQPIRIQSDRAERDERKGTITYTGKVEIAQGSLHISADHVTLAMTGNQVSRIDARGNPARLQQQPAADREPVHAQALSLQYDVTHEVLTLTEDASVTLEDSTVTGNRIEYYLQEQRVKASAGTSRTGSSRVQMVIQPRHAPTTERPAPTNPEPPAAAPAQPPEQPQQPVETGNGDDAA